MAKMSSKEKYKRLREAGFSATEARKYRNHADKNVEKLIKNKIISTNYKKLREAGLTPAEARRLRGGSDTTINKAIRAKRAPKAKIKPDKNGRRLLILWKDVTDNVGEEFIDEVMDDTSRFRGHDPLNDARHYLHSDFGEIGQWVVLQTYPKDLSATLRMYDDYHKVYFGNGVMYDKLLDKIYFMMLAIYQSFKKLLFLMDVIDNLAPINPSAAQRLALDFDIQL